MHPSGVHLPASIDHLHMAIAEHPHPKGKANLSKALQIMLLQQAEDMQPKSTIGAA